MKSPLMTLMLPENKSKLCLAIIVMMSPHLAGMIAVIFFSTMIFEEAGATPSVAVYETSAISVTLVLCSISSILLVNRVGRRPLLLIGLGVMAFASLAIVILQYHMLNGATVATVIVFVIGFAIGPGPIPFTIVPELFTHEVKRSALSVSVTANWLANFGVGFLFPFILRKIGYLSFLVFASNSTILLLYFYMALPETRPKSLEKEGAIGVEEDDLMHTEDSQSEGTQLLNYSDNDDSLGLLDSKGFIESERLYQWNKDKR